MDGEIRGAFAPVPTPLDDDGMFDPVALERHLDWLSDEGLDGVLVLGTNGEFASLSFDERVLVARTASAARPDLDLLLGVGSCALPEALELTEVAAAAGYAAVLCPPPFYFRSASTAGIAAFFAAVVDRSPLPVLLYHIPQLTGVAISDSLLTELRRLDRPAVGVKDSTGSEPEMDRLLAGDLGGCYLVGHDGLITRCLQRGGVGSISAAANAAPRLVAEVHRDPERQSALDAVRATLEEFGLGPAVKALLERRGVGAYRSRPPARALDPAARDRLFRTWDALES
jgi:dihydrodipicolinate synthase/N-acetylneuraminate lyase